MIFDAFSPLAVPLLIAGGLGGLVRGLIAFRTAAKLGVTAPVLVAASVDTITSMIIGACTSLFLHEEAKALFGGIFDAVNADEPGRVLTSGFVTGIGCIVIIGAVTDFIGVRLAKLKQQPEG